MPRNDPNLLWGSVLGAGSIDSSDCSRTHYIAQAGFRAVFLLTPKWFLELQAFNLTFQPKLNYLFFKISIIWITSALVEVLCKAPTTSVEVKSVVLFPDVVVIILTP